MIRLNQSGKLKQTFRRGIITTTKSGSQIKKSLGRNSQPHHNYCTRAPSPVYLSEYSPPLFTIEKLFLEFQLGEEKTIVRSKFEIKNNQQIPFILNGKKV
jgi:hypothetical protein